MTRQQDICGTRARYNFEDCRCAPCTEAQRIYHADRRRKVAYKTWDPWVDAEPARQHVKALQAAGLGRSRIGELAGMDQCAIWRIEHGNPKRGKLPPRQIRHTTAERILAVSASLDTMAAFALVDATGSRRRLQALVAVGWSQRRLAARLGVSPANMASLMKRPRVLASRARTIRGLYEELWNTPPQCRSTQERLAVTRAQEFAAARGWAKPMAWDDDTIDDPAVKPSLEEDRSIVDPVAVERALSGDLVSLTRTEAAEVTRIATERGMSASQIAKITGRAQRSVVRYRSEITA
jgi:transcriptional regulator with XRE-family HTH domain